MKGFKMDIPALLAILIAIGVTIALFVVKNSKNKNSKTPQC